jgi:hypothetical protein
LKISGFTFIRNAVKNDYPIKEAILSILPICDEFIVALGKSDDDTRGLIESIDSEKIKILETVWDDSKREGGRVFALETDKAMDAIAKDSDWAFYIQGDECVHENDLEIVRNAMLDNLNDPSVEGLLFKYRHFYGQYNLVASSRKWYRREIRVIRPHIGVRSYRDAQGFRLNNRKLRVKLISAHIHHYGWVQAPEGLTNKVVNFNHFYHDDSYIQTKFPKGYQFDYGNAERLEEFQGTHPSVMKERISRSKWPFYVDEKVLRSKMSLRRKFLQWIEDISGYRVGEYKNYKL